MWLLPSWYGRAALGSPGERVRNRKYGFSSEGLSKIEEKGQQKSHWAQHHGIHMPDLNHESVVLQGKVRCSGRRG